MDFLSAAVKPGSTSQSRAARKTLIRSAALVLWVTALLFSLAAVLWAWTYPVEVIRVTAEDALETEPGTAGAGFSAFARFVLGTGALALITAVLAFITQPRGTLMMFWTTITVAFSTWWFLFLGGKLVQLFHPSPQGDVSPGDLMEIATLVQPSVGLLFAPTIALLTYWLATTFSD